MFDLVQLMLSPGLCKPIRVLSIALYVFTGALAEVHPHTIQVH